MSSLQTSKFSPPKFDAERHLPRVRLIPKFQSKSSSPGRTVLIQGQAGQGKSHLAIQVLNHVGAKFAWFQLGAEEADPVLLLTELLQCLQLALPGFASAELQDWLRQGSPVPGTSAHLVTILQRDLENHLDDDFYLVFDDLHLLEERPQSLQLLATLLTLSRKKLHLILISRLPALSVLDIELAVGSFHVIENADLALNRQEIAELFNGYLKIPVSTATVNVLHQSCEGWIMGLLLAAQAGPDLNLQSSFPVAWKNLNRAAFLDYFSREVLLSIPEEIREALINLSLLDEIPIGLAADITGHEAIGQHLQRLEGKNFFVRALDDSGELFSFHHLFRECLNHIAIEKSGAECVEGVWNMAGHWYRESLPEKALAYFLRAANFTESQNILATVGMQLLAENRLVTLQSFLAQVPEDAFLRHPWLSFYNGVICFSTQPPSALRYLELAREGFVREEDEIGELAALVQLIYFHTAVDCQFSRGESLLERAIQLFAKYRQTMDEGHQVHAANIFVLGLTFFTCELARTGTFADFGLEKAQQLGLKELEAEARLARCYRDLFAGDLLSCRREIDQSLPLLKHPQVSLINKGALQLAQLNLLANDGDLEGYRYHRRLYLDTFGEELVEQSSFGAIMRVMEIDLALGRGDEAKMEAVLKVALASEFGSSLPHMRSLYLHYQACLLARQGRETEALASSNESMELRTQAGGRDFEIMNTLLLAATYTRLGYFDEASKLLQRGLDASEKAGEQFVRPGLYAYRAWLKSKQSLLPDAGEDIRSMLDDLQKTGFRWFFGWDPEVLQDLLALAVKQKIKADFALELAASILGVSIDQTGKVSPLMHFRCLGGVEVSCGDVTLSNVDLSPSMRQLLAILFSAPNHRLDQESVQHTLWPDDPPTRGRANFDTLISRIRKLFDQTFFGVKSKDVLILQKQILSLSNCRIDVDEFRQYTKTGMAYSRRGQNWQAANALRKGLALWKGEFLGGLFPEIDLGRPHADLRLLFLEGSQTYSRLLAVNGQFSEAVSTLQKALYHDPINEMLVRQLYQIYIEQNQAGLAQQVFKSYASALRKEDYPKENIEQMLESFWR